MSDEQMDFEKKQFGRLNLKLLMMIASIAIAIATAGGTWFVSQREIEYLKDSTTLINKRLDSQDVFRLDVTRSISRIEADNSATKDAILEIKRMLENQNRNRQ